VTQAAETPPTSQLVTGNGKRALRIGESLVALYMLTDWHRVSERGTPPQPGWFARCGVVAGILSSNRAVIIRLLAAGTCVYCPAPPSADSTGDHLVSLDQGGQDGLENYVPCCRNCNASKGTRDLLDWWHTKDRPVTDLPLDVLTAYARLTFAHHVRLHTLGQPASPALIATVRQLVTALPSNQHRWALRLRVDGVVGKQWQT